MRKMMLALMLCVLGAGMLQPAAAQQDGLPREVVINDVEFVLVPEGWFWYAVQNGDFEETQKLRREWHRDVKVWLDAFYIAKYEARARHFKTFMETKEVKHRADYAAGDERGCAVRRYTDGSYYLLHPELDLPVTHLSWNLADEFTRWMGFRLPTEAEWVKAARGTDRRFFPWGNEYPDDTYAGFSASGEGGPCAPVPVGLFANGKSPYGAYNMAGNVLEYVADWYNEQFDFGLKDGDRNPPLAATGSLDMDFKEPMKILKGGRWGSGAGFIHVYSRTYYVPSEQFRCFGVRFALDVATVRAHLAKGTATVVAP
ncbi:MAG TPA: formylglycine-generating enzyme family protein [Noviherbaspirillum sp.]|uniref:formylglycine-generating enzyme family protein n=1 Tax=Noviherbaspirillum sp. TaxID=1926288 RepID=UPI002D22C8B1|nr:formylglycine-generating enzyme family protein [Noviherbaspirillum sp.]HYD94712.1 formylglycine-generating enzyme family protein [Noviherbaspirillum sp.]